MKRQVEVSASVRAPLERVSDILATEPGAVFAETSTPDERRARSFRTALRVEVGSGTAVVQEVAVVVGLARATGDSCVVPVDWRAVGRTRLVPTFEGALEVTREGAGAALRLHGTYTLRLGLLGRMGERAGGRRVAARSLAAFVEALATRLDAEARRRAQSVPRAPAPYPEALRDRPTSSPEVR